MAKYESVNVKKLVKLLQQRMKEVFGRNNLDESYLQRFFERV